MKKKTTTKKDNEFTARWNRFIKGGCSYQGSIGVLEDSELSCQARVLFHIISSLSVKEGYCFAFNSTLAGKLGLAETMIKKYLCELQERRLIIKKYSASNPSKRRIYLNFDELEAHYMTREEKNAKQVDPQEQWVSKAALKQAQKKMTVEEVKRRMLKGGKKA